MIKFAVQLHTLRKTMQNKADIIDTLNRVKKIGFNAVQVAGIERQNITLENIQTVIDTCKKLNLEIVSTHILYDLLVDDLEYVIKYHKMLGCKYGYLGSIPVHLRKESCLKEIVSNLQKWSSAFKANDMIFGYHNHSFEFTKINDGRLWYEVLMDSLDDVDFELDVCFAWRGGVNPIHYIDRLKKRCHTIHLKDYTIYNDEDKLIDEIRFVPCGQGNLDIMGIVRAAVVGAIEYIVIEQEKDYGKDIFSELQCSVRYLKDKCKYEQIF